MRLRLHILTVLMLLTCVGASAASRDTLRVLTIGNSFTYDAVGQDLAPLAAAQGRELLICELYKGGVSLADHCRFMQKDSAAYEYHRITSSSDNVRKRTRMSEVIDLEHWDVITFQQQSMDGADITTFEPYLGTLIKHVRKHAGRDVRLMLNLNWAYEGTATRNDFVMGRRYDYDSNAMYGDLAETCRTLCDKYRLEVIPSGTAVQNLRTSFAKNQCTRDGYHMSYTIGRYTVACTWFEALTGESCLGSAYRPVTLRNPIRCDVAQRAAHLAVQKPYEIQDMYSGGGPIRPVEAGPYIFDEALVPAYTLPDPLVMNDGTAVTSVEQWETVRRAEILEAFRSEVYGRSPGRMEGQHCKVLYVDSLALGGLATRKEVALYFTASEHKYMVMEVYTPNVCEGPVPAFLMMNLRSNQTIDSDEGISEPDSQQLKNYGIYGIPRRGQMSERFPLAMILSRGYAFVTFFKGDVDPDFDDGFRNGVHPYIYRKGQTFPDPDQWGTVSAWAWGYSRALDYIETDSDIDASKVAAIGHSRGGKTALWAAAQDTRFAMAVSNCSGCTGAALARRRVGETVKRIQVVFPHWFCGNYLKYMDNEDALPVDQHELISLMAPRPVYVASATDDLGADPRGEYLATVAADPVYALYGLGGLPLDRPLAGLTSADLDYELPAPDSPVFGDHVAYHIRRGSHNILAYDWYNYLNFADRYLK